MSCCVEWMLLVLTSILWSFHVGWSLPLSPPNTTPRRSFIMSMKPCQDAIGNLGICMFKWDCISQNGITLSTCVDGFLFGACCKLKVTTQLSISETITIANDIDIDENIRSNIPHLLPPQFQNTKYFSHTTKNFVPLMLVSPNAGTESDSISVTSHFLPVTRQIYYKDSEGRNISTDSNDLDSVATTNYAKTENDHKNLSTLSAGSNNLSMVNDFPENDSPPDMNDAYTNDEIMVFTTKINTTVDIESLTTTTTETLYQLVNNTDTEAFILPNEKNNTIFTDLSNSFIGTENSITLSYIPPAVSDFSFENVDKNNETSVPVYGILSDHAIIKDPEEKETYSVKNINSSNIIEFYTEALDEMSSTKFHELFSLSEGMDLENSTKLYSNSTNSEKASSSEEIDSIFNDENDLSIFYNRDNSSEIPDMTDFFPDYIDDLVSSEADETLESSNTDVYKITQVYASQKLENAHKLQSTLTSNTELFTEILVTESATKDFKNISNTDELSKTLPVLFNSTEAPMQDDNLIDITTKEKYSSGSYLVSAVEYLNSAMPKMNESFQTKSPLQISDVSDVTNMLLSETTDEMLVSVLDNTRTSTKNELFDTTEENLKTSSNDTSSTDYSVSSSKTTTSLKDNITEFLETWTTEHGNTSTSTATTINSFKTNFVNSETEFDLFISTYVMPQTFTTKSNVNYNYYNDNTLLTNETSSSLINTEPSKISPLSHESTLNFTTSHPNLFTELDTTRRHINLVSSDEVTTPAVNTTVQSYASTMLDESLNVELLTDNIQSISNNSLNKTVDAYDQPDNTYSLNFSEINEITDVPLSTSVENSHEYMDAQNDDSIYSTEEDNIQSTVTISDASQLHELTSIEIAQANSVSANNDPIEIPKTTVTTLYSNITYSVIVNFAQDSTVNNSESPTTSKSNNFLTIANQATSTSNLPADMNLTTESVSMPILSFSNNSSNFTNSTDGIVTTFTSLVTNSDEFTSHIFESETGISSHTPLSHQKTTSPNPTWNYDKECGIRLLRPSGRIVGGQNTYFGKWPWQALVKEATWLGLFVKNKCGGVLINSKYVITAAHCQPGFLATLVVVLGAHDLTGTMDTRSPIARNVRRMVIHRHYNPLTFENDLALLEMESSVEFLPHVVPICLPHRKEEFTGKMAFVTGWGKLTHGGDVPNILQEVQVPIVTNGECQRMFLYAGHQKAIRSNFVCAGYRKGGQDSCEGDSGGPLVVQRDDKRWVLVGTVSHGIGCADPNLPGVYMRMSTYRPWIDSIINK